MISDFRCGVNETFSLLGRYATLICIVSYQHFGKTY